MSPMQQPISLDYLKHGGRFHLALNHQQELLLLCYWVYESYSIKLLMTLNVVFGLSCCVVMNFVKNES